MKLLFSSSEPSVVELIRTQLIASGIPCEIRSPLTSPEPKALAYYPELWIKNTEDYLTASVLFVLRCRAR
jgi:hypothetical protein